jgi:hypothetical protein
VASLRLCVGGSIVHIDSPRQGTRPGGQSHGALALRGVHPRIEWAFSVAAVTPCANALASQRSALSSERRGQHHRARLGHLLRPQPVRQTVVHRWHHFIAQHVGIEMGPESSTPLASSDARPVEPSPLPPADAPPRGRRRLLLCGARPGSHTRQPTGRHGRRTPPRVLRQNLAGAQMVDLSVLFRPQSRSMITLLLHLLRLLPFLVGGHRQLALENLALRHQLAVYRRMNRPGFLGGSTP